MILDARGLQRTLSETLDRIPDVPAAQRVIAPAMAEDFGNATRHRSVAIGHAHIDTAWLWPLRETKRKVTRTFASAAALMDDYPEYQFCASSAQHYTWIEERHPELFEKIVERVERGQWVPVGGMWVESDMNLPSGESLVRQIVFGQRYFEDRFGMRCTEVWIPDVFGYPAGLPQVFAAGGMHRFVTQKLSWNKQNRFPHSTFWWEGLDGTRVLTHFPPVDTYNAEITPEEFAFSITNFRDHGWSNDSLMPFGHGDGGGGPTREMLERARRLAHIDARATLEIDRPAAMFERIERDADRGAPVPVWRGELYFEMHRGTLTSQLKTKLGNRRCERLLVEAELWAATLGRPAEVDHLWKQVLTQQFHDILPGSSIAWVHQDAERILGEIEGELEGRIAALLGDIGTGPLLANPADAPVDEVLILELRDVPGELEDIPGELDARQTLSDGTVALRARGAGARGCTPRGRAGGRPSRALGFVDDQRSSGCPLGRARQPHVDHRSRARSRDRSRRSGRRRPRTRGRPSGRIRRVGSRVVDPRGAVALTGPAEVSIVESGPLVARVRVERSFGPSSSTVTYELRAGSPELRVHVELDWRHDEHLLSMAFPLDVRADMAMCDVQFGVVASPDPSVESMGCREVRGVRAPFRRRRRTRLRGGRAQRRPVRPPRVRRRRAGEPGPSGAVSGPDRRPWPPRGDPRDPAPRHRARRGPGGGRPTELAGSCGRGTVRVGGIDAGGDGHGGRRVACARRGGRCRQAR